MSSYSCPIVAFDPYLGFTRSADSAFPATRRSRIRSPTPFYIFSFRSQDDVTTRTGSPGPSAPPAETQSDDERNDNDDEKKSLFRADSITDVEETSESETADGSVTGYDGGSEGGTAGESDFEVGPEYEAVQARFKRRKIERAVPEAVSEADITSWSKTVTTAATSRSAHIQTYREPRLSSETKEKAEDAFAAERDDGSSLVPAFFDLRSCGSPSLYSDDEGLDPILTREDETKNKHENEHSDDVNDENVGWTTQVSWCL